MTPPNDRAPRPVLGPEHTAREYARTEDVEIRPAPIPGFVEIVRVKGGITRALLRLPREEQTAYGPNKETQ